MHQLESAEKTDTGEIVVLHPEAFLLTQWLEKGVFDSLELGYLKSMTFAVFCKHPVTGEDRLLETYQFHVDYPTDSKASMGLNGTPMTKDTLKKQAVTFIRSLVEFSGTLDELPEERWLTLKLTVGRPRCYQFLVLRFYNMRGFVIYCSTMTTLLPLIMSRSTSGLRLVVTARST